jgi:amino acid transporter
MTNTKAQPTQQAGHGFGTLPVFLAAVSTILGAVMFLRFGYAVGHLGFFGAIGVVLLGHLVTIPTAMAISEIATNRKVEGGGEYFIISRSFGARIGAAIGLSLYVSQAISVAFYCIAFAEAFRFLAPLWEAQTGLAFDPRMVSIPTILALIVLILTKGADLGVKALYLVVIVLVASLVLFFLGKPLPDAAAELDLSATVPNADAFAVVFAICFPAFTGMTAGVGLSGDLKRPARSIPLGTLAGTLVGLGVYIGIVYKLATSAPPEVLASDPLVMQQIALWGPIIPIGLAAATLSSALGSILVAPRTLQALGRDGAFLPGFVNGALAHGVGKSNEPRFATLVTSAIALVFVSLGDVDFVARLISMFFMVTYGALCAVSFLEHFAASPSYRPSFRSRWYLSLVGAVVCLLMMFQMDAGFALASILVMLLFYGLTSFSPAAESGGDLAALFLAAMAQLTRRLNIRLQREGELSPDRWRPRIVMVSDQTFVGAPAPRKLLSWLAARQGFGTYLHYVKGFLTAETAAQRKRLRERLVEQQQRDLKDVFVEVMVSPSMRSALAQTLQAPGVSGIENNTALFDLPVDMSAEHAEALVDDALFAAQVGKNVLVLRHGEKPFGRKRTVHLWLTWDDDPHAALMLMTGYILLGHREWRRGKIYVFAALPSGRVESERQRFLQLMADGRLPVSEKNIEFIPVDSSDAFQTILEEKSADADLVVKAMSAESLAENRAALLRRHHQLQTVLFVSSAERITIG